jgi:hypothetical protein
VIGISMHPFDAWARVFTPQGTFNVGYDKLPESMNPRDAVVVLDKDGKYLRIEAEYQ